MKSISFICLFVSTLVVSASAIPHISSIFGRSAGDTCYTGYGEGHCVKPNNCKGIAVGRKYCGGGSYGGDYETQCCVELVCKVPGGGTGYCRSVQNGGCPGGSFQSNDYSNNQWPCTGGDIQCCVPGQTSDSNPDTPTSNSSSTYPGGNGRIHQIALDMLKEFEGFRGDIYKDQVGIDTIGYGHSCAAAPGTCEGLNKPISEKEGEDLMIKDLEQFEQCVCKLPGSPGLNSNQFAALVSFAFNTGCYGTHDYFTDSMSRKDYKGICNTLPTTNTLGDVLVNRRAVEAKLCRTSTEQSCGCKGYN
ncbi:lysozyme-like protein [Choiromyces venosus 120613-1]|uniref:Lysozyme-like protein n=1 Tax=Choiromyces venosus 120613-1 TaxID=1336337 RepID=A0A3N4J493_9PEZI|nr:lysozyme-like protein [Choiromyces venosus 120613-1]